jgi:hypothetical protein
MDHNLQIWLIVISLALVASAAMQIFIAGVFARLLMLLRPSVGRAGLTEIADRALEAVEFADRATRSIVEILEQGKPVVDEAAGVSRRHLSHADQVVGEVLTGIERINHAANGVMMWPFHEARAWSAGARSAMAIFFKTNGNISTGKRW